MMFISFFTLSFCLPSFPGSLFTYLGVEHTGVSVPDADSLSSNLTELFSGEPQEQKVWNILSPVIGGQSQEGQGGQERSQEEEGEGRVRKKLRFTEHETTQPGPDNGKKEMERKEQRSKRRRQTSLRPSRKESKAEEEEKEEEKGEQAEDKSDSGLTLPPPIRIPAHSAQDSILPMPARQWRNDVGEAMDDEGMGEEEGKRSKRRKSERLRPVQLKDIPEFSIGGAVIRTPGSQSQAYSASFALPCEKKKQQKQKNMNSKPKQQMPKKRKKKKKRRIGKDGRYRSSDGRFTESGDSDGGSSRSSSSSGSGNGNGQTSPNAGVNPALARWRMRHLLKDIENWFGRSLTGESEDSDLERSSGAVGMGPLDQPPCDVYGKLSARLQPGFTMDLNVFRREVEKGKSWTPPGRLVHEYRVEGRDSRKDEIFQIYRVRTDE